MFFVNGRDLAIALFSRVRKLDFPKVKDVLNRGKRPLPRVFILLTKPLLLVHKCTPKQ